MIPLTILVIMLVLYSMFRSFKWGLLVLLNLSMAPLGGLLALWITGTHFSVSTGVGFLALFGVSVQTGVIMIEYINQLRARGHSVQEAALLGATRRLRPIMMTMLVASLGLVPAAMSHDIGSDSQRPFAIVIVGGLLTELALSLVLLPTFYTWVARPERRVAGRRGGAQRMRTLLLLRTFSCDVPWCMIRCRAGEQDRLLRSIARRSWLSRMSASPVGANR